MNKALKKELEKAANIYLKSDVFTKDFLSKYEFKEYRFKPAEKEKIKEVKKKLRKERYLVKQKTYNFTDLARDSMVFIVGVRIRN